MTALNKTLRRIGSGVLLGGLLAAAAYGQDEATPAADSPAETSSADAFNIPENISILGPSDPNRKPRTEHSPPTRNRSFCGTHICVTSRES